MPILKSEILGSRIEINYEDNDKEKLLRLIKKFKKRLNEFPNNGKSSNQLIILLAALKLEDLHEENEEILNKFEEKINIIFKQTENIKNLKNEIISVKDELKDLEKINFNSHKEYEFSIKEISDLKNNIDSIKKKIIDSFNNGN